MPQVTQVWKAIDRFLSAECLLADSANGGAIILFRAAWATASIVAMGLALLNLSDPSRSWLFSPSELRAQLIGSAQWTAAMFAGVYTALYARFASQWQYLAGVYNQIKAAECRKDHDAEKLAEWKHGFIEDALELHLALKPMFLGIIRAWLKEALVKKRFDEEVAGASRLRVFFDHIGVGADSAASNSVIKAES